MNEEKLRKFKIKIRDNSMELDDIRKKLIAKHTIIDPRSIEKSLREFPFSKLQTKSLRKMNNFISLVEKKEIEIIKLIFFEMALVIFLIFF